MSSRWDYLYELKPLSLEAHLVAEAARLLAEKLRTWPPDIVEWSSERDQERFSRLIDPEAPRPDDHVFREAFRLARWELSNEFEAVDEYMRNERWQRFLKPEDLDTLVFLSRYLTEEMFAIGEATEGRIGRRQLIACMEETERRLFEGRLIVF